MRGVNFPPNASAPVVDMNIARANFEEEKSFFCSMFVVITPPRQRRLRRKRRRANRSSRGQGIRRRSVYPLKSRKENPHNDG